MSWSRVRDAALLAALLAAVVVSLWALRSGHGSAPVSEDAAPAPPDNLAADTEQIRSEVRPDGTIVVTHWLRTPAPVDRVQVRVPTTDDGTVVVRGLEVGGAGSPVVSSGTFDGERIVPLDSPSDLLYVRYELGGAVVRSDSAPGRSLATVTFADVEVANESHTRLLAVAGGTVRALACTSTDDPGDQPVPCGRQDGDSWRVRLPGQSQTVHVSAQVDLPPRGSDGPSRDAFSATPS